MEGAEWMEEVLTIEKIFHPGNQVQINFPENTGPVKTYTATVITLKDEGLFLATKETEFINRLDLGGEIAITYIHSNGTKYFFGSYKIANIIRESPVIVLAKPWRVNYKLLRRYFRFKVDLPFYYQFDENVRVGQIFDLSACGLAAVVPEEPQIKIGAVLMIQLTFPSYEPFQIKGEIVRCKTIQGKKKEIGINFFNMDEEIRQIISKCLLQTEYEPIKIEEITDKKNKKQP